MLLWRHGRELGRWRMADDCGFRDPSKLRSRLLASNRRRYLVEWLNSRLNPNDHERIATKPQKIPVAHLATEPSIQKGALEPKNGLGLGPCPGGEDKKRRSALPCPGGPAWALGFSFGPFLLLPRQSIRRLSALTGGGTWTWAEPERGSLKTARPVCP